MTKSVYDLIKKQNGERFARAIRDYDNGIFEVPNIVDIVKYAGRNATPILPYLESLKVHELNMHDDASGPNPFELLHRAGYRAEYADTLEKQNAIKKYFAPNEELCTFRDMHRFENYYIINAVRHDVDKIQRKSFTDPEREDEYGTSVISIQMAKRGGFISIKNRYNHTVTNPDNTYGSNPDNIIYGLSASLMRYFDISFNANMDLPDGYTRVDNRLVHYNLEVDGIYFGGDFYVKNGEIVPINKDYQILIDNFVLDLRNNTMTNVAGVEDCFHEIINTEISGKKLKTTKPDADGTVRIFANEKPIMAVQDGQLIGLNLPHIQNIPSKFLHNNTALRWIDVSGAQTIGNLFLCNNLELQSIDLPKVQTIGAFFLANNYKIQSIDMPNVTTIDEGFISCNHKLKSINIPKAEIINNDFLYSNTALRSISIPNVKTIGCRFLYNNERLQSIDAPSAEIIGHSFLFNATALKTIAIPKARIIDDCFMVYNRINTIIIPDNVNIGKKFLGDNKTYRRISPDSMATQNAVAHTSPAQKTR